jgi:hypothetical protein
LQLRPLVRFSGVALAIGGVIAVLSPFLEPAGSATSVALSAWWVPVITLFMIGDLLICFGLIGLYIRQAEATGALGLAVFVLAMVATILSVGVTVVEAYVFPFVAALPNAPPLLADLSSTSGPLPLYGWLYRAMWLFYEPGYILLSILAIRTSIPSRPAGWLLLFGSVVSNAMLLGAGAAPLAIAGLVAFGLALAWMGYLLAAERSAPAVQVGVAR